MSKFYSKSQNAKIKLDGVEGPTITNFYRIDNRKC